MTFAGLAVALSLSLAAQPASPPEAALGARLSEALDAARSAGSCPGIAAGIALPDGTALAVASGVSDRERGTRLAPGERFLAGSVGKTFVAAVALQLVAEGRLSLDDRIEKHLGREPGFERLPNARTTTVRMLLNHTSGLVRYEFDPAFLRDLTADPNRTFRPDELLAYLFDRPPPFPAGERFEYSDTNYIVLGMIVERVTGKTLREEIESRCLRPHGLAGTVPSDSRRIPGLVVGYAGTRNAFGGADRMVVDGEFVFNPQFEWAGGGYASTAEDLARWMRAITDGKAYERKLLDAAIGSDAVDASRILGRGASYGLGLIVREGTPLGRAVGHSGFFPGYLAETWTFTERRVSVAVLCNTSDAPSIGRPVFSIVLDLARIASESASK